MASACRLSWKRRSAPRRCPLDPHALETAPDSVGGTDQPCDCRRDMELNSILKFNEIPICNGT
jgi:hypothetical protein